MVDGFPDDIARRQWSCALRVPASIDPAQLCQGFRRWLGMGDRRDLYDGTNGPVRPSMACAHFIEAAAIEQAASLLCRSTNLAEVEAKLPNRDYGCTHE